MNLVDLILLICLAGWMLFYALAFALFLIERLREIITGETELARKLARLKAEAATNTPQPEIEAPSWTDGVLLCLSPSMRAEFSAYMDGLPARPSQTRESVSSVDEPSKVRPITLSKTAERPSITLSSRESLEGLSPLDRS